MGIVAPGSSCTITPKKVSMFTVCVSGEGYVTGRASDTPVFNGRNQTGWGGNMPAFVPSPSRNIPTLFPDGSVYPHKEEVILPKKYLSSVRVNGGGGGYGLGIKIPSSGTR